MCVSTLTWTPEDGALEELLSVPDRLEVPGKIFSKFGNRKYSMYWFHAENAPSFLLH